VAKTATRKYTRIAGYCTHICLTWLPAMLTALILGSFLFSPSIGHAINPTPPVNAAGNSWDSLNAGQKQALGPLQQDWNTLTPDRKKKWLVFADKFQKMKPEDQQRAQQKMETWVKLTPEQRLAARENYIRSNKLEPDQRAQKWEEYQQLSDEQKAKLASHEKKKLVTNLPTPAESKEKKLQPLKTPIKPQSAPASLPNVPVTAPSTTAN